MSHRRTIAVLVALTMVVGLVPFIPAPPPAQATEPEVPAACASGVTPGTHDAISSVTSTSSTITVTLAEVFNASFIELCYPTGDGNYQRRNVGHPDSAGEFSITNVGRIQEGAALTPDTDYWVYYHTYSSSNTPWFYIRTKPAARVLVSNIEQTAFSNSSLSSNDQAQGFTTGANADGYTLASVEVDFGGAPSGLSVKVATGLPSTTTVVATLTNPDSLTAGTLTFTAPEGTVLAANTTYYVVVEGSAGSVRITQSAGEDSGGLDDWSVADNGHHRTASSTGAWTQASSNRRIRINGVAKSPPPPGPPAKPAAPTVAFASASSVTVSWTEPSANPAITDYDVQYRKEGATAWTDHTHTGTAVTATITGLEAGYRYEAQVRATNSEGTSDWSDAGTGHTGPAVPLSATTTKDGSGLSVTFTKPITTAGRVHRWFVTVDGSRATPSVAHASSGVVGVRPAAVLTAGQTVSVEYDAGDYPGWPKALDADGLDVASFSTFAVENVVSAAPSVSKAVLIGSVLTITFDEALANTSTTLPAGTAFTVKLKVGDADPVTQSLAASNPVAISSDKLNLTLTLASAPAAGVVTLDYAKPDTNPLKDSDDEEVESFTDRAVLRPAIVTGATTTADGTRIVVNLNKSTNTLGPTGSWTVGAGSLFQAPTAIHGFSSDAGSGVRLTLATAILGGQTVTLSYTEPSSGTKILDSDNLPLQGFTARMVTNAVPVPAVTGVEIVSFPGADQTYQVNDWIRVQLTFSETVTVTGEPRLFIKIHDAGRPNQNTVYETGSGTTELVFRFQVVAGNMGENGVLVVENSLALNAGTINSTATGTPANLAHDGLALDANHKVNGGQAQDTAAPTFASATVNGTSLQVTFNENLDTGSKPAGAAFAVTATPPSGTARTISGTTADVSIADKVVTVTLASAVVDTDVVTVGYTKPSGATAKPLRDFVAGNEVATFSGQSVMNSTPGPPRVSAVAFSSNPGTDQTYKTGDVLSVGVTFGESVTVTGTPRIKIKLGAAASTERWATYASGSPGTALIFSYTVVAGDVSTGAAVVANSLELNGGTILLTDTASTMRTAVLSHPAVAAQTGHKVDGVAPTITTVAFTSMAGADNTYAISDVVSITTTWSENVTVDTTSGTPSMTLTAGTTNKAASYASGTGTNQLVFTYTVVEGDADTDGASVPASEGALNSGTIADGAGNPVAVSAQSKIAHAAVATQSAHKIDGVRPTVSAASVSGSTLAITFNETLAGAPLAAAFTVAGTSLGTQPTVSAASVSGAQVSLTLSAAVPETDTGVTVSYAKASAGSDKLKDAAGNEAADISSQAVDTADTTPPSFVVAGTSTDGTKVEITFNETLNTGSTPAPGRFHVSVTVGTVTTRRTVASGGVSISGDKVTLTLSSAVGDDDTVKVRYATPTANPLEDTSGNDVETFGDQQVANNTDTRAPSYVSAETSTDGTKVIMTFNEALDGASKPAASAFRVAAGRTGDPAAPTGVEIAGAKVTLTLGGAAIEHGKLVNVRYDKPATNPLRDPVGNEAASVPVSLVANKVPDTTPPMVQTAVTSSDRLNVIITFNEAMSGAPPGTAFTVSGTTLSTQPTVSAVTITGTQVRLTLNAAVPITDTGVKVSYTKPTTGTGNKLTDGAGNEAADFTDQAVMIVVNPTQPAFVDGNAKTLMIAENHGPEASVGTVAATDADGDAPLNYWLAGADLAFFSIGRTTGEIKVKPGVTLNYEARSIYSYNAVVSDGEDADGNPQTPPGTPDDTITVTIQVTDVDEPPDPPEMVTVYEWTDDSLSVGWLRPAETGPDPVSDYDVRYYAGAADPTDETDWIEAGETGGVNHVGTATTAAVTGLTPATAYRVQVRATAEGAGEWSASAGVTTLPAGIDEVRVNPGGSFTNLNILFEEQLAAATVDPGYFVVSLKAGGTVVPGPPVVTARQVSLSVNAAQAALSTVTYNPGASIDCSQPDAQPYCGVKVTRAVGGGDVEMFTVPVEKTKNQPPRPPTPPPPPSTPSTPSTPSSGGGGVGVGVGGGGGVGGGDDGAVETPAGASARFDDVAAGVWYEQAVSWMITRDITHGCAPALFCPDQGLTRQQFVTFLWRAAGQPTPEYVGSAPFSDVTEGAYSDQAIGWAVSRGVTQGCTAGQPGDPDWRFCPTDPVTRGQMGTFMYRHVEAVHEGRQDRYTDVNPGSAHAAGVAWLADFKVIGGCETAMFCPDRPATRAEAAAIIHGVATRPQMWGPGNNPFTPLPTEPSTEPSEASARFDDVAAGVWYEPAVSWMIAHEVTAGCDPRMFCPDEVLTRQEFVTFLWRAAGQPTPEYVGSAPFSDVTEGAYSDQAIGWAVSRGVTQGCTAGEPGDPDWRFCPTEPVTRGQMGTFMYRHVEAVHEGRQDRYTDVSPDSAHAAGVAWLADFKVIGGCETAMFCPDRPATRAEAAAIIHGVATRPQMWGPGNNSFTPQPTQPSEQSPSEQSPSEEPTGATVQPV